jgi:putative transposase
VTRTLRVRVKDKHAKELLALSREVNLVWNYVNELSVKVLERERKFLSAFDLAAYTAGTTKEGLGLHSQSVQAIGEEYVKSRKQAKKARLRWRLSGGKRRSLGWVPFKASALRYRGCQLWVSGISKPLSVWDSYGLKDYELGTGSFSEDARGRWYFNATVQVERRPRSEGRSAVGIDLGLKDLATTSEGLKVEAQRFYRGLEPQLAEAQRKGEKHRVKKIHAKIANRRKDHLHKLSHQLVQGYGAIFVGDVGPSG